MKRWLTLLACVVLLACDKIEQQYSTDFPVSFTFNTTLHPASLLTRLRENSNAFVIVEAVNQQGAWRLQLTSNSGEKESLLLSTDRENNSVRAMGANNSLILGCVFVAGDPPYQYVAYDRQCRYCLDNSTSLDNPLTFQNNLTVGCSKCHRTYSLLTGTSTDGQRLHTYHANYITATGLLSVTNR